MAATVTEIMNREVFTVGPEDDAEDTLGFILSLGITAAPVVDDDGVPIGVISMRDIVHAPSGSPVRDRMSIPPIAIAESMLVDEAARALADTDVHHLVVTGDRGQVVGFVSSVDLLRAVLGKPVRHPSAFPHLEPASGLTWTDDYELGAANLRHAPDGPGRLALVQGAAGQPETILWLETSKNVRARLREIVGGARNIPTSVAIAFDEGSLRFRAAALTGEPDSPLGRLLF